MPTNGVRKIAGSNPPATPVTPVIQAVTKAIRQTIKRSKNSNILLFTLDANHGPAWGGGVGMLRLADKTFWRSVFPLWLRFPGMFLVNHMTGAILALISAAIFGFQNAAARRAVVSATPLQGMVLTVPTVVPALGVGCYLMGGFDVMQDWPIASYVYAGLAGLMHFVIGRNSNYHSMRAWKYIVNTDPAGEHNFFAVFSGGGVEGELQWAEYCRCWFGYGGPALLIGRRKALRRRCRPAVYTRHENRDYSRGDLCCWLWI